MCGRYALHSPPLRLQEQFGTTNEMAITPHYNIAPSHNAPVVRVVDGRRILVSARWGLMPSWAKEEDKLPQPINAKAETAAIKPMFRQAYRRSRVLVPADCFYEWKVVAGKKQPYLIHMEDGSPFGMGGLLEHWEAPEGETLTFTILTTSANALMKEIHDRMPVIIQPEDYKTWLDPQLTDVSKIQALVAPYPEQLMAAYPVSTKVNNPKNDTPDITMELPK
jgi:putative SOS response-associated peptidase YedK